MRKRSSPHHAPRALPVAAVLVAATVPLLAACASGGGGEEAPSRRTGPPVIEAVVPDSAPAGTAYPVEVTLRGRGFAPRGNAVRFGPVVLRDVPSEDGEIRFQLPKEMPAAGGEASPPPIPPGEYGITVTTPAGTSEPVTFTLTDGPSAQDAGLPPPGGTPAKGGS